MKENIFLIGGSSSLGVNLINKLDTNIYNIYITYFNNKKILKDKSLKNIYKIYIDLKNKDDILNLITDFKKKKLGLTKLFFYKA